MTQRYTGSEKETVALRTSVGGHAEGFQTKADGVFSHAEGYGSGASNQWSHAEGYQTATAGDAAHAEGSQTYAGGPYSHAEGLSSQATGAQSHAEGNNTMANNQNAHAEGNATTAAGASSHAEGMSTNASAQAAHAEGNACIANANYSHAEGFTSTASGVASHAQGSATTASGYASHSGGVSSAAYAHTQWALRGALGTTFGARNQTSIFPLSALIAPGTGKLTFDGLTATLTGASQNVLTILPKQAYVFQLQVVARVNSAATNGASNGWVMYGALNRDTSGSARLVSSVQAATFQDSSGSMGTLSLSVNTTDATNNYLEITGTNSSGNPSQWAGTLIVTELQTTS